MSDVAKDMADYLESEGVGTVGTNIFYDQTPVESELSVTLATATVIESGGFDPQINYDRKHYNPTIQIMVTGTQDSNTAAKAMNKLIVKELNPKKDNPFNVVVDDTVYYSTAQVGGNNFLGYNANNRPEWSLNFRLRRRESNV